MTKGTMTNFDICKAATEFLLKRGYTPSFSEEELKVECDVDGINFSVYGLDDEHYFGYSCRFDYGRALSADEKDEVTKRFKNEEPVIFENLHFVEDGVILSCALPTEFFTEDDAEEVITSLHRTGGIIKYLKTNLTKCDRRKNMINLNKVMKQAEQRLNSLGYSPKHNYDDQLDCIINGISFAIYGSDDGKTFGFGCIFEPETNKYADGFFEELQVNFEGKYAPFQNLQMSDDGFIHLEGESDIYNDSLIDDVVRALSAEEYVANVIKAKSYVWEEN